MNLAEIRQAVADSVADVAGVRPYAYVPDFKAAGQADVVVVDADDSGYIDSYQEAFRNGLAMVKLRLTVYVQASSDRTASIRMDELLSSGTGESRSLIDAVMADVTLGGLSGGVCVDRADAPRFETVGEARMLVCDVYMRVPAGRL